MAKYDDSLDSLVAELKRVDDEALTSLSHNPAAQALYEEVTSVSEPEVKQPEVKRRSRRRRLLWEGALAGAAVVIVLAVLSIVNVFGADGPSIVDKAVAALAHSENAIMHVKITGQESGKDGYAATWTEESWASTASPYLRRDVQAYAGSPVVETVTDNAGFSQAYDAAANIIYQPPQSVGFHESGGQEQYREMILGLLQSGEAVTDGNETIDGRDLVRILSTKDYGVAPDGTRYETLYLVDAKTYDPVQWHMTRDGGKDVTLHFDAYEELPATEANLALLDLTAQHPGAVLNTSLEDYQKSLSEAPPAN